jgi:dehydrogenase/reductase SDR family protein 12
MDTRTLLKIINFYARFTPNYTKIGYFARKLGWPKTPPLDFSGQNWLITGASSGIGKGLMRAATEAGATVVAVSSSQANLDAAIADLPESLRSQVTAITGDMSLLSGTQELLGKLLASGKKFDVLQNNAGVLFNDLTLTSEGRETTYVINVLSHYVLTKGLVEGGAVNDDAVVVNMTSGGMYNAPLGTAGLNVTDPAKYNGKASYAYAKRAQVALTDYWNRAYGDRGISFYVTHPGWTKTPGVKKSLPVFAIIQSPILRTPRQGADTALWLCATRPPVEEDVVWFDRKTRVTHMYNYTRKPQCTIEELVEFFENDVGAPAAAASA